MKIPATIFFFLLLACALASLAKAEDGDDPMDRVKERFNRKLSRGRYGGEDDEASLKRIRDHDQRRTARMQELIEQRTQQLEDHDAGHRRLSDDDHERFNRQIKAFTRKLEQVNSMSDEL